MDAATRKQYFADNPPPVVPLQIKPHFEALSEEQKLYAHYLSRASFAGTRIVLRQVSPESEPIYDFIISLYKASRGDFKSLALSTGVSDTDLTDFLCYAAQFLGNGGNYKSFGDQKFIPRCSPEVIKSLASVSRECTTALEKANSTGGGIFETKDATLMHLGYTELGHMTTYYPESPHITKDEITAIGDFLEKKNLLIENTRLKKTPTGDFDLLIASGIANPPSEDRDLGAEDEFNLSGNLSSRKLKLVYGDYINEMAKVALNTKKAERYAANDIQKHMMQEYTRSFGTGSMQAFKESQRWWIKDKGPTVESDIGFVETYRDPHGVRGEWEGFVAMVNLDRTKSFAKLVESAETMIPKLPWTKDFEKDTFLRPDFTSLEVMSFATSGVPVGINIPNMDDIRQNEGFKNVSLGNVLSAKAPNEPIPFIREVDQSLYRKYRDQAFEIQVGVHELLGHGTGKLLQETSPGQYNFNVESPPISPVTNRPISTWYKPGQTWSSVFGAIASGYEECRAECVAMVLACDFEILRIFGAGNGTEDMNGLAGDVLYTCYLQMARAGILSLESWDPKSKKWGQAHSRARFSILQVFLSAGDSFVTLKHSEDDLSDLEVVIDRSKILSHGRPAVEKYLQKLQVYKSTADVVEGTNLFEKLTSVDEWWAEKVRKIVMEKKVPRKVLVQANSFVGDDGKVVLKEYEPSLEGMIQSWAERDI